MMAIVNARTVVEHCLALAGTAVDNTFGDQTDVCRVGEKIFALVNIAGDEIVTLKALPDEAAALVAQHDFVRPGYYMNKKHWITVDLTAAVDDEELGELIAESYRLVLGSLSKRLQAEIVGS